MQAACDGQCAVVGSIERKRVEKKPPKLYDLTTLQREANRYYGLPASQTLQALQELYEEKLVTYPRTDSQFVTEDMRKTVESLVLALDGQTVDVSCVINNSKVTDHHAILPTMQGAKCDKEKLSETKQKILSLIIWKLVQAVQPPLIYEDVLVTVCCQGGNFTAKYKDVLQPGYTAKPVPFVEPEKNKDVPFPKKMEQGMVIPVVQAEKKQGFTSPPKVYTEDTLLSAMETAGNKEFEKDTEKKGLGTPATRAAILEKLVSSGYVQRKGKQMIPTEDGVTAIRNIPDYLKSASMTAEWENDLLRMERGEIKPHDFMQGIENQKELIQRYISRKESLQNLPVMDFVDDGYTGSNFDRPGFQQMMDGVRSGKIDTIIVKDLSRFGRDYISVGEYMEQIFPLLGVRLIAINDNYDSDNYKGTTLGMDMVVSNLVNTMYCRDAGKKLRTANQVKWRKGITTASAAPFGYRFDPDKKGAFIIDPPAAKIVRRIFDLAILGLGTREIAMMLNDENIPVPSVYNKENKAYGKETTYTIAPVILWDSSRVWKILTAYVYTGAMVLGKTKTLISGKSIVRTVPKGQQYITEGTHEAIVSREEFEKAQLVIKSNSHKVLMGSVDFPLKGKVRCGNCRRVMAHNFKQVVPTFWCREGLELVGQTQCTSEIFQVSDIESAVFQALKKELSLLDSLYGDIQKEEQALKEAHKKANRRKTLMEQELKNLKGEKMRMYEEYAAGTLPLDTYKQKKQECDRRISEVQEQIEQSKAEESAESVVPGTVRAAAEQAENFLNGTRLTAGMVSAFIENVFVHDGGRIVVRFKYEQSIQNAVKALHTD